MSSNNPFANIPSLMQKQEARSSLIDAIIDVEQQVALDDDEEDINNETFGGDDFLDGPSSDMPEFFNFSVPATAQPAAPAAKINNATSAVGGGSADITKAASNKPISKKAEAAKPADTGKSATKPESKKPESKKPESKKPETAKPEVAKSSVGKAVTAKTEAVKTGPAPAAAPVKPGVSFRDMISGNNSGSSSNNTAATTNSSSAITGNTSNGKRIEVASLFGTESKPKSAIEEISKPQKRIEVKSLFSSSSEPSSETAASTNTEPAPASSSTSFVQESESIDNFPPGMGHQHWDPNGMPYPPMPYPPMPYPPHPHMMPFPPPPHMMHFPPHMMPFPPHMMPPQMAPPMPVELHSRPTSNPPVEKLLSLSFNPSLNAGNRSTNNDDSRVSSSSSRPNNSSNLKGNYHKGPNNNNRQHSGENYSPRSFPRAPVIQDKEVIDWMSKLPKGQKMSKRDIEFVVRKVLEPLDSVDPFDDNYYHIKHKIIENSRLKKIYEEKFAAIRANGGSEEEVQALEVVPDLFVPLPKWKDLKIRIRSQIDSVKLRNVEKSKNWAKSQKVLGNVTKSQVGKPREVIAMPGLNEILSSIANENSSAESSSEAKSSEESSIKVPYASVLWTMREAVQKGYEALYTVQELYYLQTVPSVTSNANDYEEITNEMHGALQTLSQSLGLRVISKTVEEDGISREVDEITIESNLVGAILQTSKGKRLLSRCLVLLSPEQKWALLPAIIVRILQVNPADMKDEDKSVEAKLIYTIMDFVSLASDHHLNKLYMQDFSFAFILLNHVKQCINAINITFDFSNKAKLKLALLGSESRAKLLDAIVKLGDLVSNSLGATSPRSIQSKNEWENTYKFFLTLIE